jgi:AcrR family transcriptional regulator
MGLRERKKELTRNLIAETAWRLFAERGFERVTVAEVARRAEVAEATVFNYFPTKEDLVYQRLEAFGERLIAAVGARDPGQPVLAAFRRHLVDTDDSLLGKVEAGDREALHRLRTVNQLIAASPTLQARERRALARVADSLARLLAEETGAAADDLRARVVANALMGVHRALIDYTRARVLADDRPERLAGDLRRLAERAFDQLEHGLGDYAPKRSARQAG